MNEFYFIYNFIFIFMNEFYFIYNFIFIFMNEILLGTGICRWCRPGA